MHPVPRCNANGIRNVPQLRPAHNTKRVMLETQAALQVAVSLLRHGPPGYSICTFRKQLAHPLELVVWHLTELRLVGTSDFDKVWVAMSQVRALDGTCVCKSHSESGWAAASGKAASLT